ncbi:hypothetical protein D3C80_1710580 [compost metagenome]
MRCQVHPMHHRQQRVGRAMHHKCRHAQLVEQRYPARFGKDRHDLALGALRVERPVIGHGRLLHQRRTVIVHLGAAQCCQQISLLFDGHLAVRRTAPGQQLHQGRIWRGQPCGPRAGHHQRQAAHPLRRHRRQVLRDHPPHADTQHMELVYAQ